MSCRRGSDARSLDRRTVAKGRGRVRCGAESAGETLALSRADCSSMRPSPSPTIFSRRKRAIRLTRHTCPRLVRRPEVLQKINYEEWGKIRYRDDYALFADGPGPISRDLLPSRPVFPKGGRGCMSSRRRSSRQIIYDQSYFDMPADLPARDLPKGAGFAGLRIQEARDGALDWHKNDWVAFLGAAYFRSIGELRAIWPVVARRRARCCGRRSAGRISRLH